MPELHYTDEELDLQPGWDEGLDRNIRRELREARILQAELKDAKSTLTQQARELTLLKAGVPADARGEFFAKAYDGPDDVEAIKASYASLFGNKLDESQTQVDLEGEQRIASSGNETAGQPGVIPLDVAIKNAKTNEEVFALIEAADFSGYQTSDEFKIPRRAREQ